MQEEYTKETRKENKTTSGIYEIVESLVLAIVCVILIFTFIARMSIVSGASMEPTLHDKDYLVVSNLFFSYNFSVEDIKKLFLRLLLPDNKLKIINNKTV